MRKRFPTIRTWMIGRGAIIDPFLPGEIKGRTIGSAERLDRFQDFHQRLYEQYARRLFGPSHLLSKMKGLWGYFHMAFDQGRRLRKAINKTQKPSHFESVVSGFFASRPEWRREVTDDA